MGLGSAFGNAVVKWEDHLQVQLDKLIEDAKTSNNKRYLGMPFFLNLCKNCFSLFLNGICRRCSSIAGFLGQILQFEGSLVVRWIHVGILRYQLIVTMLSYD